MKNALKFAASAAVFACLPATAQAQESRAETYVGLSAGYHDLGADPEVTAAVAGLQIEDSSPIVGAFAGVDFPLGGRLFAGIEANYHFGTDVIDHEYGASGRLGIRSEGGAKFYVRGGYQEVDIDPYKVTNVTVPPGTFDGIDDSEGDYLVGAGVDFPIGRAALRFNIDTIGFDTLRPTAGVAFRF